MARHFIWVRPLGQRHGGKIVEYTPAGVLSVYTDKQIADLALGRTVLIDGMVHLDLVAHVTATEAAERDRDRVPVRQSMVRQIAGLW